MFNELGSISVPVIYVYQDFNIGKWLAAQRSKRTLGRLSNERIVLLDKLNFDWNTKDTLYNAYFEKMIVLLKEYIEEFGNSHIPNDFIYHGEKLGEWARNIRYSLRGYHPGKKKLSNNQRRRLEDLGFSSDWYNKKLDDMWNKGYAKLKKFIQARGSKEISTELIYEGNNLGSFVHYQRAAKKEGTLSEYKEELLRKIRFDFSPKDHVWDDAFSLAKKCYEQMGNLDIPSVFVIEGFELRPLSRQER